MKGRSASGEQNQEQLRLRVGQLLFSPLLTFVNLHNCWWPCTSRSSACCMSTETVLQTASILLLPPPSDLIHEEKPPCPGLLTHSLGRPCTSAATTTGTGTDAETKLPPTTHEIDARVRVIVDVHVPTHLHPPLPPITTRRSEGCCVDTRRVNELERGSAIFHLRERDRVLEDTQAPENTHPHAISDSTSDSESPSVMRAEKQGVGGSGAANAGAQTQSHGGDDGQGLGERAEGGEGIDIDDDGASDSQPPPHHA